jgi:hypothetical protein
MSSRDSSLFLSGSLVSNDTALVPTRKSAAEMRKGSPVQSGPNLIPRPKLDANIGPAMPDPILIIMLIKE